MKNKLFYTLLVLMYLGLSIVGKGQMSSNTVNYKVSYDVSSQLYTVWVIPNYSTPNSNNLGATEKGATAQVTLKVPTGFVISAITDVAGVWDKNPTKMGPNQQSQFTGQGLDANKSYYTIGKGASETDYGAFVSGSPVALFTFKGNGCLGAVEVISKTDPFVSVADTQLSLNVAPSFYSRSGQPSGGNQNPLEQYNAPAAGPANCIDAINDSYTATAGTPATQNVLSNDGFNGGVPTTSDVTVSISSPPSHGTASVNPDGTITYTPDAGYSGTDTYTYQICDKLNPTVCDVATVSITVVCPVMAAPTGLSANPNPVCAGSLTTLSGTCATGTITWYSDAALTNVLSSTTVIPPSGAGGLYYAACVNGTCKSTGTSLVVNVTAMPTAPTGLSANPNPVCAGSPTTLSGTCATGTLTWYSDAALTNVLSSTTVIPPSGAGGLYYAACVNGTCKSTGTSLLVNVTAMPTAPTGLSANPNPVCAGSPTTLSGTCATGTLTWYSDAALTTTVTSPVSPAATTTYYAACVNGACKSTGTSLVVNVSALPATPVPNPATVSNVCPALTIDLTSTLGTPPAGVSYEWHNANNTLAASLVATPTAVTTAGTYYVFAKNSTACYSAASGSVAATLTPCVLANPNSTSTTLNTLVNIPVLANDTNNGATATLSNVTLPTISTPSPNGTATVKADGTIDFSPTTGFVGTASFIYQLCDKVQTTVCDTALVTVNVGCPTLAAPTNAKANPNPICAGSSTTLTADACSTGTLTWYSDAALTNVLSSTTVIPPSGAGGLYYAACVNATCKSPASNVVVTVSASACNQAPVATNDIADTPQGKPVTGNVLTNDTDPEGTPLTVSTTPTTLPSKGTVVLNPDGTYTYTPSPTATGQDTFCYKVCDAGSPSMCDTACVVINIIPNPLPSNDKPVANDDNTQTEVGVPVLINAKANDTDPDGNNTLGTPSKLTNPTHGTVTQNPDGTFTYTPNPSFTGTDSFTYQICDNGTPSKCDTATVTINVVPTIPGNNPPVAVDDANLTTKDTPVSGTVAANDSDVDNTAAQLTYTKVTNPTHGTVTQNADGTYTYIPTTGYVGSDSYTYKVCDPSGACDVATVSIAILDPGKVALLPQAYLQGALFGVTGSNLMRDDLRVKGLLPSSSPYLSMGMTEVSPTGTVASSVFAATGTDAIVDWVFVELRDVNNNQQVLDSRSALIQRDGDIVDLDGVSALQFSQASPASYYVVIKHRNHLGVMSKAALPLNQVATVVDFRSPSTPTYTLSSTIVDQAQVVVEQGVALWAGNALYDNKVIYQGTGNDVNTIYQQVINASGNVFISPYYKLKGYYVGDVNMNGEVIFQGTGNDIEYIYQNVIKNHPGNVLKQNYFIIKEQLP